LLVAQQIPGQQQGPDDLGAISERGRHHLDDTGCPRL
jgi:hypothetical protein